MESDGNAVFVNLNDWAHTMTQLQNGDIHKDMTNALVIELISKTENFPLAEDMNGIDLRKIYALMADVMTGNPTELLNEASMKFLGDCYKVTFILQYDSLLI